MRQAEQNRKDTRATRSRFARAKAWSLLLGGMIFAQACQLAPSDPKKLERLRDSADLPTVVVSSTSTTAYVGDLVRVNFQATTRRARIVTLTLDYSTDDVTYVPIGNLTTSATNYTWLIPATLASTHLRFRVTALTSGGASGFGLSDRVAIGTTAVDPGPLAGLRLTNFLGGSLEAGGTVRPVTFTPATGDLSSAPLALYYSTDSGMTWSLISGTLPNVSPFAWTLPVINSTTVRLRLTATDRNGATVTSASTANFEINSTIPPELTTVVLTFPAFPFGSSTTAIVNVGTATVGDSIRLYTGSTCAPGTQVAAGTAIGPFISLTTAPLSEGNYSFHARAISPAGNLSPCSAATATYSLDLTAPPAPSGLALSVPASSPGGASAPTLSVSGVATGDFVELFTDACIAGVSGSGVSTGSSISITAGGISAGTTIVYHARATDAAGNVGPCSTATVSYTYALPTYTLSQRSYSIDDGAAKVGTADLTVTRDLAGASATVTLTYDTVTALGGEFSTGTHTVSFGPSDTSKTVAASVAAPVVHTQVLGDKFFRAKITALSDGGHLGAIPEARVNLIDRQLAGDFFFPVALYSAMRADASVVIQVQRTGTLDAATVDLAFLNGTATGGTDFAVATHTVSFAAGVAEASFAVPLSATAGSKSFYVELKNPSGSHTLRPWATAKVRIVDPAAGCDPTNTAPTTHDGFGGGDGTSSVTPYLICSLPQLYRVRNYGSAFYRLDADLDLDPSLDADPGTAGLQPFTAPVGNFSGVFEGGEHVLRNYRQSISVLSGTPIGIFSVAGGSASTKINALNVDQASIVSTIDANDIGGIVGATSGGLNVIANSSFSGLVSVGKDGSGGGIVGRASGSMTLPLTRDFSTGLIQIADDGSGPGVGGIVGGISFGDSSTNASMSYVYSTATAFSPGGGTVGGLFGWSDFTFDLSFGFDHSHSKGLVRNKGGGDCGGLAGTFTVRGASAVGPVSYSYSNSPVYCGGNGGGLFGTYNCSDGTLGCSFSHLARAGNVTADFITSGSPRFGGIAGRFSVDADASVDSITASGTVSSVMSTYSSGGAFGFFGLNATSPRTVTFSNISTSGLVTDLSSGRASGSVAGVIGDFELTSGTGSVVLFDTLSSSANIHGGGFNSAGILGAVLITSNWGANTVRLTNSNATGNIAGVNQTGGLIGSLESNSGAYPLVRVDHSGYSTGTITAAGYVAGGAVGTIRSTAGTFGVTVDHVSTAGTLNIAGYAVGGVVGYLNTDGGSNQYTLSDLASSMSITSSDTNTGGLVGSVWIDGDVNNVVTITKSQASGSITGDADVGGLVGYLTCAPSAHAGNKTFTLSRSSANVSLSAPNGFGAGFVAEAGASTAGCTMTFEDLHAEGSVSAKRAGGMFGAVSTGGGVTQALRSYTRLSIDGRVMAGGIYALVGPSLTACYWQKDAGIFNAGVTDDANELTDAQLQTQTSFSGYDFTAGTGIWTMSPGPYPTLQ